MTMLEDAYKYYATDLDELDRWIESEYNAKFAEYFKDQRALFARMKSESRPISDTELETVLVEVPLQLFSASEALNAIRLKCEAIKLENKQKQHKIMRLSSEKTDAKKKEEAEVQTVSDKLLILVMSTLIARVENEVSFSRELIMSAKKIWDSRRRSETSNPVNPISTSSEELDEPELKEY